MWKDKERVEIIRKSLYHCERGNEMDRDRNAAINIREEARRMLTA